MTTTYRLTPRAHLLLAIEALKFAKQEATSEQTRRKIAAALASARRDVARLKKRGKSKRGS